MDPVVIAQEGVDKFKRENFEIIIVDTRWVVVCITHSIRSIRSMFNIKSKKTTEQICTNIQNKYC